MPIADRRALTWTAAALPLAMVTSNLTFSQTAERAAGASDNPAPAKDVTGPLAHYLVTATYDDLPGNVRKEGARTLLTGSASRSADRVTDGRDRGRCARAVLGPPAGLTVGSPRTI
jgi:hypothetical protein